MRGWNAIRLILNEKVTDFPVCHFFLSVHPQGLEPWTP